MGWWFKLRMMWTVLLLTWSIYLQSNGLFLAGTLAFVLGVVVSSSSLTGPTQGKPDPVSVILVVLWRLGV